MAESLDIISLLWTETKVTARSEPTEQVTSFQLQHSRPAHRFATLVETSTLLEYQSPASMKHGAAKETEELNFDKLIEQTTVC
ncbi:hypothetical protein OH492_15580 [Vibrio chagasii]|nr:hypothetical protein [Vibrio chagasii]